MFLIPWMAPPSQNYAVMNQKHKIVVFQEKQIRRIWHHEEWWFSIIDVIEVLSESKNPRRYWSDLKRKLKKEGYEQLYEKIVQLKLEASDGKNYKTDVANTETMFRIIQSIPSPNAEPFKRWLAKVGYERVQEIENPEFALNLTIKSFDIGLKSGKIDLQTCMTSQEVKGIHHLTHV